MRLNPTSFRGERARSILQTGVGAQKSRSNLSRVIVVADVRVSLIDASSVIPAKAGTRQRDEFIGGSTGDSLGVLV